MSLDKYRMTSVFFNKRQWESKKGRGGGGGKYTAVWLFSKAHYMASHPHRSSHTGVIMPGSPWISLELAFQVLPVAKNETDFSSDLIR